MLRCVIFDLDNTIVDSDLDFAAIKAEIGTDEPILEYAAAVDGAWTWSSSCWNVRSSPRSNNALILRG